MKEKKVLILIFRIFAATLIMFIVRNKQKKYLFTLVEYSYIPKNRIVNKKKFLLFL